MVNRPWPRARRNCSTTASRSASDARISRCMADLTSTLHEGKTPSGWAGGVCVGGWPARRGGAAGFRDLDGEAVTDGGQRGGTGRTNGWAVVRPAGGRLLPGTGRSVRHHAAGRSGRRGDQGRGAGGGRDAHLDPAGPGRDVHLLPEH